MNTKKLARDYTLGIIAFTAFFLWLASLLFCSGCAVAKVTVKTGDGWTFYGASVFRPITVQRLQIGDSVELDGYAGSVDSQGIEAVGNAAGNVGKVLIGL